MTFEEASDMAMLYSISPELTCDCDDDYTCQQCLEQDVKSNSSSITFEQGI